MVDEIGRHISNNKIFQQHRRLLHGRVRTRIIETEARVETQVRDSVEAILVSGKNKIQ